MFRLRAIPQLLQEAPAIFELPVTHELPMAVASGDCVICVSVRGYG